MRDSRVVKMSGWMGLVCSAQWQFLVSSRSPKQRLAHAPRVSLWNTPEIQHLRDDGIDGDGMSFIFLTLLYLSTHLRLSPGYHVYI